MPNALDNLRIAYQDLERQVTRSLRTQLGDVARLQEQQRHILAFLQAAEMVRVSFYCFSCIPYLISHFICSIQLYSHP